MTTLWTLFRIIHEIEAYVTTKVLTGGSDQQCSVKKMTGVIIIVVGGLTHTGQGHGKRFWSILIVVILLIKSHFFCKAPFLKLITCLLFLLLSISIQLEKVYNFYNIIQFLSIENDKKRNMRIIMKISSFSLLLFLFLFLFLLFLIVFLSSYKNFLTENETPEQQGQSLQEPQFYRKTPKESKKALFYSPRTRYPQR